VRSIRGFAMLLLGSFCCRGKRQSRGGPCLSQGLERGPLFVIELAFFKGRRPDRRAAFSDILALDGDVTTACLASLSSTIVNRVTRVTARFREKTKLRSAPGIGGDPCFRYENMRKRSLV